MDITESPIHTGQIFAEMLGAVNHPKFFDYTDVEVLQPFISEGAECRPMLYISNIPPSNYTTVYSQSSISMNSTIMARHLLNPRELL